VGLDPFRLRTLSPDNLEKSLGEIFQHIQNDKGKLLFSEVGGKIIGFGFCYIKEADRGIGHISKVFVDKDQRGKGVGKALIKEMENYLKGVGCSFVTLNVFYPNQNAYQLYKRRGYFEYFTDMIKPV
ncbi:MAG: GNAT family N-acetyltransferase, partial [bacterium]